MSRPSAGEVAQAARRLEALIDDASGAMLRNIVKVERDALRTLIEAAKPRTIWLSKEVTEALNVTSSNLHTVRGLPKPVQTLPRPTVTRPDKVLRVWDADEVRDFRDNDWSLRNRRADG